LAPVPLTTICFRAHPRGIDAGEALNRINDRLMNAVNASGRMFVTRTKLSGITVLRLVVSHLRTEEKHVRGAWQLLQDKLGEVIAEQ
jgi:aromatic-L-amino-acid decarboxylase